MTLVFRINAYCSIGHDGFRTGGGNCEEFVRGIAVAVGNDVAQMIEMALGILVDNLVVRNRRKCHRVPVDHAYALVNPAFLVEIHEGVDNGLAQFRLHGEAGAVPVAGCAKLTQLLKDNAAVLFFPLPSVLKELLTADILLADTLGCQLCHNLVFRGN